MATAILGAATGYVASGLVYAVAGAPSSISTILLTSAASYAVRFGLTSLVRSTASGRPLYVYRLTSVAGDAAHPTSIVGGAASLGWNAVKLGTTILTGTTVFLLLTVGAGGRLLYRLVSASGGSVMSTILHKSNKNNMSSLLEDLTDWEEVSPGTTLDLRLEREEDASTDITDEEHERNIDEWLANTHVQDMIAGWCVMKTPSEKTHILDEWEGCEEGWELLTVGQEDEDVVEDGEYLLASCTEEAVQDVDISMEPTELHNFPELTEINTHVELDEEENMEISPEMISSMLKETSGENELRIFGIDWNDTDIDRRTADPIHDTSSGYIVEDAQRPAHVDHGIAQLE